jgi:hypothetical protein
MFFTNPSAIQTAYVDARRCQWAAGAGRAVGIYPGYRASLPGDLNSAEPGCDLLERAPLLVGLHGEAFEELRLWCMLGDNGEAVAEAVAAMRDERNEGLSR